MKVINSKNLPLKSPFLLSIVTFLCLDKYNPAGWVWGVFVTIVVILWIIFFFVKSQEDDIDIFAGK